MKQKKLPNSRLIYVLGILSCLLFWFGGIPINENNPKDKRIHNILIFALTAFFWLENQKPFLGINLMIIIILGRLKKERSLQSLA